MIDSALLERLGLLPAPPALERLEAFHKLLLAHSRVTDLTKVPEEEMTLRHYADSLAALRLGLVPQTGAVVDVGSGAGFPGLPLAIAAPGLCVTLLEAREKRCAFLETVIRELGLPNVTVACARAEDAARTGMREAFDRAAARALAPLPVLAEYLLPFVKPGGLALCWKGPAVEAERADGARAATLLGGRLGRLAELGLPGRSHFIQVIEKTGASPQKYPRKAGVPAKNPL